MIVVLIFWLALILIGASRNKKIESPIGSDQSLALRGICAIEIMIGHIGLATGSVLLYPNRKAGILFVGIFFMLSGYGVAYSLENKPNYLQHFLVKRFLRLLLPAYLAYVMYKLVCWLILQNPEASAIIDLGTFLRTLNWYVWEQLFFYIVFWCAYKIIPKYKEVIIGVMSISLIIVAFTTKMDNPWYGSTMCFLLGMCYYKFEKRDIEIAEKRKGICFWISSGVLILSMLAFFTLGNESVWGNPVARNVASMCFCMMTLIALSKIEIGNALSRACGKCSYEIFLIHPFVMGVLESVLESSKLLFAVLTIVITLITAYFLNILSNRMLFLTKINT